MAWTSFPRGTAMRRAEIWAGQVETERGKSNGVAAFDLERSRPLVQIRDHVWKI